MSKNKTGQDDNNKEKIKDTSEEVRFGAIKPLTAAQVVTFLLISEKSMGACACACGGPCGAPCY